MAVYEQPTPKLWNGFVMMVGSRNDPEEPVAEHSYTSVDLLRFAPQHRHLGILRSQGASAEVEELGGSGEVDVARAPILSIVVS